MNTEIDKLLSMHLSNNAIARIVGKSEGAIRYHKNRYTIPSGKPTKQDLYLGLVKYIGGECSKCLNIKKLRALRIRHKENGRQYKFQNRTYINYSTLENMHDYELVCLNCGPNLLPKPLSTKYLSLLEMRGGECIKCDCNKLEALRFWYPKGSKGGELLKTSVFDEYDMATIRRAVNRTADHEMYLEPICLNCYV